MRIDSLARLPLALARRLVALLAAQALLQRPAARAGTARPAVDVFGGTAVPCAGAAGWLVAAHPQAPADAFCSAARCASLCREVEAAGGVCIRRPATETFLLAHKAWLAGCTEPDATARRAPRPPDAVC